MVVVSRFLNGIRKHLVYWRLKIVTSESYWLRVVRLVMASALWIMLVRIMIMISNSYYRRSRNNCNIYFKQAFSLNANHSSLAHSIRKLSTWPVSNVTVSFSISANCQRTFIAFLAFVSVLSCQWLRFATFSCSSDSIEGSKLSGRFVRHYCSCHSHGALWYRWEVYATEVAVSPTHTQDESICAAGKHIDR